MLRQPVHPKYHFISLQCLYLWLIIPSVCCSSYNQGSSCFSGRLRRYLLHLRALGWSVFISSPLLTTGSLEISRFPWSLSRTFIWSPWLVLKCPSFGSSKPPILCHSSESKSCERYPQGILVLKGIINIIQLLKEQFSFNFFFNFPTELRGFKLEKSF
ncbi:hypothetical protein M9H77_22596 [Catharanthus roseus]|uniref:Uncharacterized protein n=1 Tax=Catharanthus roseus TaxID=4058 RepID=A0ACC0ATJ6_CATRO|nr:hypothetical protein M9H77_22596 [Catharanthus roseus]